MGTWYCGRCRHPGVNEQGHPETQKNEEPCGEDAKATELAHLALRLFGVGANSASTERFLSQAGIIHNKLTVWGMRKPPAGRHSPTA